MAYLLRVQVTPRSAAYCALNGSERLPVTDELAAVIQVLNTPDTTATLGGQLACVNELGTTLAVPYTLQGGGAGQFPTVGVLDQLIGPTPGEAGQGRAR